QTNSFVGGFTEFFETKFVLGEKTQEKPNHLQINSLWLTVLAQYLKENNPELAKDFVENKASSWRCELNEISSQEIELNKLGVPPSELFLKKEIQEEIQRLDKKIEAKVEEIAAAQANEITALKATIASQSGEINVL